MTLWAIMFAAASALTPMSARADACASNRMPGPLSDYPGPATTGVPAGTALTMVDGDYRTTRDGEVIDRLEITGRLYVDHDNVKVKCTHVRGMTTNMGVDLKVWLSTLGDPAGVDEGSALKWSDYTLRRVDIMGTYDGLKAEGNVDVRDSYIHDLFRTEDPRQVSGMTHNDGVQIGKGSNMVFKHNTFLSWSFSEGERAGSHRLESSHGDSSGYMTSAFLIAAKRGPVKNVLIEDNLIRGRTSKPVIAVEKHGHDIVGLRIINNVMGRENRDFPKLFAVGKDVVVRGNVFIDGAPVEP